MENREFISIEDVAMWYPYKGKDKAKATRKELDQSGGRSVPFY
ncbi:MAG: hypothetical protein ACLUUO_19330 [Sellimonas intestinalis]